MAFVTYERAIDSADHMLAGFSLSSVAELMQERLSVPLLDCFELLTLRLGGKQRAKA